MRYWAWSALTPMIYTTSRLMLHMLPLQVSINPCRVQVSAVYLRMYSITSLLLLTTPSWSQWFSPGKPRNALRIGLECRVIDFISTFIFLRLFCTLPRNADGLKGILRNGYLRVSLSTFGITRILYKIMYKLYYDGCVNDFCLYLMINTCRQHMQSICNSTIDIPL